MIWEWDDRKNEENIRKHGIDFAKDFAATADRSAGLWRLAPWRRGRQRQTADRHPGLAAKSVDVTEVFTHPMLTVLDRRRDYGEDRWIGLGLMKDMVVVVVFVEHEDENRIRIISAQKATRYETRQYAKYLAHRLGTSQEDAGPGH